MNDFNEKTIMITGSSGLIGSNLVKSLLKNNNTKVIAVGRNIKKLNNIFYKYKNNSNLILLEHDICSPIKVNEKIDYVFHAAGPIAGNIIREYPMDVILPNIIGTINVLNFIDEQKKCNGINAKLIVFSSATVYGNKYKEESVVTEDKTYVADDLDAVNAPYSESKRMVEVIAKSYSKQKDIDVYIARFSYVYGYANSLPNTAFYQFIKEALAGRDIILKNSDLPKRDNIYIDDAIQGLLTVALKGEKGQSYNISTNREAENFAAIDEMAEIIVKVVNEIKNTNINLLYEKESNNNNRSSGIVLCNDKLSALGWKVNTSLEDGIRKTVENFIDDLEKSY
jgi:nucleoside-diphosphate-sugar epimerase